MTTELAFALGALFGISGTGFGLWLSWHIMNKKNT